MPDTRSEETLMVVLAPTAADLRVDPGKGPAVGAHVSRLPSLSDRIEMFARMVYGSDVKMTAEIRALAREQILTAMADDLVVTVGTDHSDIAGGKVQRKTIRCGGGNMGLARSLANKSAAVALLDQPGERHDVILADAQLLHGRFLDLSTADVVLAPGGIYTARVGMQQIVFKVDRDAQVGKTPIAGRLLQLQPH